MWLIFALLVTIKGDDPVISIASTGIYSPGTVAMEGTVGQKQVVAEVQGCLDRFIGLSFEEAIDMCGASRDYDSVQILVNHPLNIATVNGQRRIDGGEYPGDDVRTEGPRFTFSSILGGDTITFDGETTSGDWVEAPVSYVISVSTAYTDAAGNTGAAGNSAGYTIDTIEHTVAITMADSSLIIGETTTVPLPSVKHRLIFPLKMSSQKMAHSVKFLFLLTQRFIPLPLRQQMILKMPPI